MHTSLNLSFFSFSNCSKHGMLANVKRLVIEHAIWLPKLSGAVLAARESPFSDRCQSTVPFHFETLVSTLCALAVKTARAEKFTFGIQMVLFDVSIRDTKTMCGTFWVWKLVVFFWKETGLRVSPDNPKIPSIVQCWRFSDEK